MKYMTMWTMRVRCLPLLYRFSYTSLCLSHSVSSQSIRPTKITLALSSRSLSFPRLLSCRSLSFPRLLSYPISLLLAKKSPCSCSSFPILLSRLSYLLLAKKRPTSSRTCRTIHFQRMQLHKRRDFTFYYRIMITIRQNNITLYA